MAGTRTPRRVKSNGGSTAILPSGLDTWSRWRHLVVETAVLVVQDHQQTLFLVRACAQRVVHLSNKVFTILYIVGWVLVISLPLMKVDKVRLDESEGSQFPTLQVTVELVKTLEMTQPVPLMLQEDALRDVSIIYVPCEAVFEGNVEDGLHLE